MIFVIFPVFLKPILKFYKGSDFPSAYCSARKAKGHLRAENVIAIKTSAILHLFCMQFFVGLR